MSNTKPLTRYTPLEDQEKLLEAHSSSSETSSEFQQQNKSYPRWLVILSQVVFSSLALAFGIYLGIHHRPSADAFCTSITSEDSVVLHSVSIHYSEQQYNGSLFKETSFRQNAGPEVDAAWRSLGVDYRSLRVPESLAAASGIDPDQVKINPKYGGGYPANVEGLHHLHCLNLLRQTLVWNYDYYHSRGEGAFKNDDNIVKSHVTHCLDIIRQQLMCTIDTGVLGQVWLYPNAPKAYVDFNTKHTCKNFEAVRQWAEDNQLPEHIPEDFLSAPKEGDRVYEEIP